MAENYSAKSKDVYINIPRTLLNEERRIKTWWLLIDEDLFLFTIATNSLTLLLLSFFSSEVNQVGRRQDRDSMTWRSRARYSVSSLFTNDIQKCFPAAPRSPIFRMSCQLQLLSRRRRSYLSDNDKKGAQNRTSEADVRYVWPYSDLFPTRNKTVYSCFHTRGKSRMERRIKREKHMHYYKGNLIIAFESVRKREELDHKWEEQREDRTEPEKTMLEKKL